jgi:ABC-type protease/lipase transport system fused ATPase/permease subunit
MKRAFRLLVGVAAIVSSSVLAAQAPAHIDLLIGMWKQNMEKSTSRVKTMTERFTTVQGQRAANVLVFEKQ